MKLGQPGPNAESYGLGHLRDYLSVTYPAGTHVNTAKYGKKNQPLDTMLIQYFLLKLGTTRGPGQGSPLVDDFDRIVKKYGRPFRVDGKFGVMTSDAILSYQMYASESPADGPQGGIHSMRDMKIDGTVHPGPDGSQGLPIGEEGRIYTIAHLNERFLILRSDRRNFILADNDAPPELKREVARLLPEGPTPLPIQGAGTAAGMASFHVARARHFPLRR